MNQCIWEQGNSTHSTNDWGLPICVYVCFHFGECDIGLKLTPHAIVVTKAFTHEAQIKPKVGNAIRHFLKDLTTAKPNHMLTMWHI